MDRVKVVEEKIINMIKEELVSNATSLIRLGVRFEPPEIEVLNASSDDYESEFRIWFYRGDQFLNIIESHIFRDGKQLADEKGFKRWFNEALQEIIKEEELY